MIAGLLFMAGMRRSEVSALRWADVVDSTDGDGVLVTVRRSKTNQEGEVNDCRRECTTACSATRGLRLPGWSGDRLATAQTRWVTSYRTGHVMC